MNTTIQELKKQKEEKHTALFNSCGVFWAFSNEQFDKNKTPLQDGEKYVSIGAGGYVPKFSLDRLLDGMEEIRKWFKKESTANKDIRRAHILSELSNYECFYTGDISEALAALGEGYTAKEVRKVYQELSNYECFYTGDISEKWFKKESTANKDIRRAHILSDNIELYA